MRAIRVHQPGPPEALVLEDIPAPAPRPGWVLIRVRAFGLNRSEMFTRKGHSPNVRFPRVLGIECVGTVEAAPETELAPGQTVAALMGGMGRAYDGGYAELALVPRRHVLPLTTDLEWPVLAALPETYLTAWGSLVEAIGTAAGDTLLIRGATSSVGMAALSIARSFGAVILATTRDAGKADALRAAGADHVVLDGGTIAAEVKKIVPGGVRGVLELVGTVTLRDSLAAAGVRGVVCQTGILGNSWVLENFEPLQDIPSTVRLTIYESGTATAETATDALQRIVDGVASGIYRPNLDRVFRMDQIVEAHRYMEENRARGKLVVVTDGDSQ
jgi:NADPH:quinone reductase-like Zn-dependent oxidoreductase